MGDFRRCLALTYGEVMDRSEPLDNLDGAENDDQIVVSSPRDLTLGDVDQANRRIEMLDEKQLEARTTRSSPSPASRRAIRSPRCATRWRS
jgi:hypothetical protein